MARGRGRKKQTRRERKAMSEHLEELLAMRSETLADLGQMTVEMAREGRFDKTLLAAKAEEAVRIDGEADLIVRGLEEKLTLDELEDIAKSGDSSG